MSDPVQTLDGQVYERENIEAWFALGHRTSPLTNSTLSSLTLTPVPVLRRAKEEFLSSQTAAVREVLDNRSVHARDRYTTMLEDSYMASSPAQHRAWRRLLNTA